ncbi:5-formyltetrahydrofolate cyclo-ligase [Anaerococcus kampingiae]|uniref:5-formyltetrahydrofolate cyclo-ligase n=1 Tax=Anaerococcus kampingae TaxID=3115614 RepID=A0ABW9MFH4_9FIRM
MKSEFRRFFLNLRREMDDKYIKNMSDKICENLLKSEIYKDSQTIFVYVSMAKEVETRNLIKKALADGKDIYVPKIIDRQMKACKLNDLDDLELGLFGIPTSRDNDFIENPDLTITPGLSFDEEKNRLGYGGGYYDKFFAKNKTIKAGLMISDFLSIKLPIENTDVKVDFIITEEKNY